jgi:hypothetical protein
MRSSNGSGKPARRAEPRTACMSGRRPLTAADGDGFANSRTPSLPRSSGSVIGHRLARSAACSPVTREIFLPLTTSAPRTVHEPSLFLTTASHLRCLAASSQLSTIKLSCASWAAATPAAKARRAPASQTLRTIRRSRARVVLVIGMVLSIADKRRRSTPVVTAPPARSAL